MTDMSLQGKNDAGTGAPLEISTPPFLVIVPRFATYNRPGPISPSGQIFCVANPDDFIFHTRIILTIMPLFGHKKVRTSYCRERIANSWYGNNRRTPSGKLQLKLIPIRER